MAGLLAWHSSGVPVVGQEQPAATKHDHFVFGGQ
jgi:hypothetical protein